MIMQQEVEVLRKKIEEYEQKKGSHTGGGYRLGDIDAMAVF